MPRANQAVLKPQIDPPQIELLVKSTMKKRGARLLQLFVFPTLGAFLGLSFYTAITPVSAVIAWLYCLLFAAAARAFRPGALEFLLVGVGIQTSVYFWLPASIAHYGQFGGLASFLLWCGFILVSAIPTALAGFFYARFRGANRISDEICLGLSWMTAELVAPGLIPWKLAHTQLPFPLFSGGADLLGVSLLSGLMLYWASIVVAWISDKKTKILPAIVSMLVFFSYNLIRERTLHAEIAASRSLALGIIQPNLSPQLDFKPENLQAVLERERKLSAPLLHEPGLDLLIWPESSVWIDYPHGTRAIQKGSADDPFPGLETPLLFGGQSSLRVRTGLLPKLRNAVFLMSPDGQISGSYYKHVLFPFSERIPFAETFPWLKSLSSKKFEVAAGDAVQPIITFSRKNGESSERIRAGVVICYEDLWSDPLRRQVDEGGAEILFSLSNDAWFQHSPAVREHHLVAAWRAVELRRYLIRVTMDGVTAVVDPFGQEVEKLPSFIESSLRSSEVRPMRSLSLFAEFGDLPLLIICAVLTLWGALVPRQPKGLS